MPDFNVQVFAVDADDDPGIDLGQVVVKAKNESEATDKAYDALWDEQLSATCNARFRVSQPDLADAVRRKP